MNEAGEQSKVTAPLSSRCEGCGKPSRTKCSKCNHFVYCGVTCQKRIWPCHKYVCPRIEDLVVNPEVSTLFGVGDPIWEGAHKKLDSERIEYLREVGEDNDPEEHPDYLLCMPAAARKLMIEYLDVKSLCRLDSVVCNVYTLMAWHEALRGTYSAALSQWPRNRQEDGFACLKWSIHHRVELRDIRIQGVVHPSGNAARDKGDIFASLCHKKRFADIAWLLVTSGSIDPHLENGSQSLLLIASSYGRVEVARALIDRGADINKAMNNGATPLYIASQNGHVEVVRVLVEKGADIDKAKDDGVTPLLMASDDGHVEVGSILAERGADIN